MRYSLRIVLAALILACSAPAYAATLVVDQDGQGTATSCSAATAAPTILPASLLSTARSSARGSSSAKESGKAHGRGPRVKAERY